MNCNTRFSLSKVDAAIGAVLVDCLTNLFSGRLLRILTVLFKNELVCYKPRKICSTHAMGQTTRYLCVRAQELGLLSDHCQRDLILALLLQKHLNCMFLQCRCNLHIGKTNDLILHIQEITINIPVKLQFHRNVRR